MAFAKLSTKPIAEAKDLYFDLAILNLKKFFGYQKLDPSIKKYIIDVNGKILLTRIKSEIAVTKEVKMTMLTNRC